MSIGEISGILGLQTILAGFGGWLGNVIAGRIARREQSSLDERLKTVESQLSQQALEHEVQFRRTDEKLADVLSETYERLFYLYLCTTRYVSMSVDNVVKRRDDTETANEQFCDFFFPKSIHIPKSLYEQTNTCYHHLVDVVFEFNLGMEAEQHGLQERDHWVEQTKALKIFGDEVFPAMRDEFRKRLGVKD